MTWQVSDTVEEEELDQIIDLLKMHTVVYSDGVECMKNHVYHPGSMSWMTTWWKDNSNWRGK